MLGGLSKPPHTSPLSWWSELKSVEALSDTRTQVLLPGAEADPPDDDDSA